MIMKMNTNIIGEGIMSERIKRCHSLNPKKSVLRTSITSFGKSSEDETLGIGLTAFAILL
jgi:hypothetical protein